MFLWWEEWKKWENIGTLRVIKGREVNNENARFGPRQVTDLMQKSWDEEVPKVPWVKFNDLIQSG